jgi:hypothetical protein
MISDATSWRSGARSPLEIDRFMWVRESHLSGLASTLAHDLRASVVPPL